MKPPNFDPTPDDTLTIHDLVKRSMSQFYSMLSEEGIEYTQYGLIHIFMIAHLLHTMVEQDQKLLGCDKRDSVYKMLNLAMQTYQIADDKNLFLHGYYDLGIDCFSKE